MRTKADKGEGGYKNYIFFADVLHGWSLNSCLLQLIHFHKS